MIDPTNPVGRVRLLTGDIDDDPELQFFPDAIYQYYLDDGLTETEAAIEITNSIIASLSLQPARERTGSIEVYQQNLSFLEKRLAKLESDKARNGKIPVIVSPGQKSWNWLDNLFPYNKED